MLACGFVKALFTHMVTKQALEIVGYPGSIYFWQLRNVTGKYRKA